MSHFQKCKSVVTPLGTTSNVYDGATDRLLRVSRTGSPATLYAYDALGNLTTTALDADGDGQITSADRVSLSAESYEQDASNAWWRVTSSASFCGGVTNASSLTKVLFYSGILLLFLTGKVYGAVSGARLQETGFVTVTNALRPCVPVPTRVLMIIFSE